MKTVTFCKEPGRLNDLFFLFIVHYNKTYCLNEFAIPTKNSEDTAYLKNLLSDFSPIPDNLRIYFDLSTRKLSFMTHYYHNPFVVRCFDGDYRFQELQQEISNQEQVSKNLADYYFRDDAPRIFENGKVSLEKLNEVMQTADLSDAIKNGLFSFYINPEESINNLLYELITKNVELNMKYEEQKKTLTLLEQNFDLDYVTENMKRCKDTSVDMTDFENIRVSFALFTKNLIKFKLLENACEIMLGQDYIDCLEYLIKQSKAPDLESFGSAVSEPNRVKILNYILEYGEVSIREVEQKFGFSGTNTYYHLSLMIKSGILKTRNRGRIVLYSVNTNYFTALRSALLKYAEPKQPKGLL